MFIIEITFVPNDFCLKPRWQAERCVALHPGSLWSHLATFEKPFSNAKRNFVG